MQQRPDIDINDVDRFPLECHTWFRWLRAHEPLSWHPGPGKQPQLSGFWSLVRHTDVVWATRVGDALSSEGAEGPGSQRGGNTVNDSTQAEGVGSMMIQTDPPRHTAYRKLVSRGFTPRSIAALEQRLRSITVSAIDAVAARGECDFVQDLAAMLPLQAISELLGVPRDERLQLIDWTNTMTSPDDPDPSVSRAQVETARQAVYRYAAELGARKRRHPEADLASRILLGEIALADATSHRLSQLEFEMFMLMLIFAGNETTRSAISGAVLAFSENPDQWERLRRHPELMPTAVEEILRYVSPVAHMRRTVTRDTQLHGQTLRKGARVLMWYPSANRDETLFGPTADSFEIARHPNWHLAFGAGGPHFCLGASLARLEIRLMLEELMRRMPDIRVAGKPVWARSNIIYGPMHLPVRFTAVA